MSRLPTSRLLPCLLAAPLVLQVVPALAEPGGYCPPSLLGSWNMSRATPGSLTRELAGTFSGTSVGSRLTVVTEVPTMQERADSSVWESAALTRLRSQVRALFRPPPNNR